MSVHQTTKYAHESTFNGVKLTPCKNETNEFKMLGMKVENFRNLIHGYQQGTSLDQ